MHVVASTQLQCVGQAGLTMFISLLVVAALLLGSDQNVAHFNEKRMVSAKVES